MLVRILQGKAAMQRQVQLLVALRCAAKDKRASSLAGAGSSMGGGTAGGPAPSSSLLTGGGGGAGQAADPEARLQSLVHELAAVLKDVSRPEDGEGRGGDRVGMGHPLGACSGVSRKVLLGGRPRCRPSLPPHQPRCAPVCPHCRPAEAVGTEGQPHLQGPSHNGHVWLPFQRCCGRCACCHGSAGTGLFLGETCQRSPVSVRVLCLPVPHWRLAPHLCLPCAPPRLSALRSWQGGDAARGLQGARRRPDARTGGAPHPQPALARGAASCHGGGRAERGRYGNAADAVSPS